MILSKGAGLSRAIRTNDLGAVVCLFWGGFFVLRGETMAMTRETGPAMIAVSVACFAMLVALPFLVRVVWRRVPSGEDEYLRRLMAVAGASGAYFALAVFIVWTPLSGSLLPALAGAQVIGLLLIGASLGWLGARWLHSR